MVKPFIECLLENKLVTILLLVGLAEGGVSMSPPPPGTPFPDDTAQARIDYLTDGY